MLTIINVVTPEKDASYYETSSWSGLCYHSNSNCSGTNTHAHKMHLGVKKWDMHCQAS